MSRPLVTSPVWSALARVWDHLLGRPAGTACPAAARLDLTRLEPREVPALYAVGLLSPYAGDPGESAATHSGGLTLDPTLPTSGTRVLVDAPSEAEAIRHALAGTVTVVFNGQTAYYPASAATIGLSPAEHLPYVVVADGVQPSPPVPPSPPPPLPVGPPVLVSGTAQNSTVAGEGGAATPTPVVTASTWRVKLEDLAWCTAVTCDWDYNDRSWAVSVEAQATPAQTRRSHSQSGSPSTGVAGQAHSR